MLDVDRAIACVTDTPPRKGQESFRPALLRSQGLVLVGANDPNFTNDLTERICAAYYALRQAEVYDERG